METTKNQHKVEIRNIQEGDLKNIRKMVEQVFHKTGMSELHLWGTMANMDTDISIVVTVDGELAGFYFLAEHNIPKINNVDYAQFENKRGLEGIALGVFPKYKNKGVGKRLIEYTQQNMNYDYIWGMQLKSLENINDWLKRRKIYYESSHLYITYRMLK